MTDTSYNAPKNATIKPRLSLLSSKQSGIRLRSEDEPDKPPSDPPSSSSSPPPSSSSSNRNQAISNLDEGSSSKVSDHIRQQHELDKMAMIGEKEIQPVNGATQADENRMNVSKEDLIRLLSMLKSELQSKEIALASIKLEQLKRLINPVEISRSSLANTYIELQDRLKSRNQLKNGNNTKFDETTIPTPTSASKTNQRNESRSDQLTTTQHNDLNNQDNDDENENLNMLSTLLELLDRHPLLALPRDSIYCLDYNCNELSTKNYLNLKIKHLDNLIDQHRRFRYYMGERLKRSEQRYMDLTLKLELERNLKLENERAIYRNGGKTVLLRHIDELKEALEKEKASKHAIVMTLLNELLDERERNANLTERLVDLEKKLADSKPQPSICKPRVPAKPAQLLDKQRSQSKDR